jgi:hypothetical protein
MTETRYDALAKRIEQTGWGALMAWFGACYLNGTGVAVGLLGVAIVILGAQAIRGALQLAIEDFWIVVGCVFAAGGLWHSYEISTDFGSIVLMALGAAMVLTAFFGKKHRHS